MIKEIIYLIIAVIFGGPVLTLLSIMLIEGIKRLFRRR